MPNINKGIKLTSALAVIFILSFSMGANAQNQELPSIAGGGSSSCTVTVNCQSGAQAECTSILMDCEMNSAFGWVKCDGITTYCN